jgi:flagellar motility protein MotE (MotC chaperone)
VLQDLAKRRDEIETRSRELDMRENVLAAAAKKIDGRIAELKTLESKIQGLLQQRDEQNEKNLKSLVKVYENMKPQDAARIFEKLDMPILLDVAGRMREAKLAQVLANMNPDKARSITTELATWRQTPDSAGKNG